MDALILSCHTGGGHNAAGSAVQKELTARGHHVDMLDPYSLTSDRLSFLVGNAYVKTAQRMPRLFGAAYMAGELVRHFPGKSPVYWLNAPAAMKLAEYLGKNHYDVIITPHLFPAEMLTYLKKRRIPLPLTVFVATDYTCIPFTEETECDFYVIPGKAQMAEFEMRGIDRDKLVPFGIPAAGGFYKNIPKDRARMLLGLDADKKYILVTGGSIGAGKLQKAAEVLAQYRRKQKDGTEIIMICGNNRRLYRRLASRCRDDIRLLQKTEKMPLYMRACDVFISKPGGLSSTEAAVTRTPFIQMTPIPGCESHNMRYFTENGMALGVKNPEKELVRALQELDRSGAVEKMRAAQGDGIPEYALFRICDWLETVQTKAQSIPYGLI